MGKTDFYVLDLTQTTDSGEPLVFLDGKRVEVTSWKLDYRKKNSFYKGHNIIAVEYFEDGDSELKFARCSLRQKQEEGI